VRGPRHDWFGNCPCFNLVDVFCTHRDGFLDKKSSKPFVGGIDIFREEKCLYCTYVVSACFGVSEYSACNG